VRIEAHTDLKVPLGTVEVRQYLGERPMSQAPLALDAGSLSPTMQIAASKKVAFRPAKELKEAV
jgi:hypothetical protein